MSIFYKEGEFVPVFDILRRLVDKYKHFIYNFGWKKSLLHEDELEASFVQPVETSVEEQRRMFFQCKLGMCMKWKTIVFHLCML